jgi:hypothetical protein
MGERRAIMGKEAPNVLPIQMIKREAMRRPLKVVAPPPEPQLISDIVGREDERGRCCGKCSFWQLAGRYIRG